jgi:tripartite-type tricarboxylate transporter receptor subunit TctC
VIDKLNLEINKALKDKTVAQKLSDQGADLLGGSPEQFQQMIRHELTRWAIVVKDSGSKLD